jgi:hypothetical protein
MADVVRKGIITQRRQAARAQRRRGSRPSLYWVLSSRYCVLSTRCWQLRTEPPCRMPGPPPRFLCVRGPGRLSQLVTGAAVVAVGPFYPLLRTAAMGGPLQFTQCNRPPTAAVVHCQGRGPPSLLYSGVPPDGKSSKSVTTGQPSPKPVEKLPCTTCVRTSKKPTLSLERRYCAHTRTVSVEHSRLLGPSSRGCCRVTIIARRAF